MHTRLLGYARPPPEARPAASGAAAEGGGALMGGRVVVHALPRGALVSVRAGGGAAEGVVYNLPLYYRG